MVELAPEGMTMMCVTHEMGFALKVANRVIFMDRGQIIEDCSKQDFFDTPRSERATQFCVLQRGVAMATPQTAARFPGGVVSSVV